MNKKIKVIVDDVELEVLVSEEELAKLTNVKESKKTGYERVKNCCSYYTVLNTTCVVSKELENNSHYDISRYQTANYYSDGTLAENNARADKLMRQLRRFAAENCEEADWCGSKSKYHIIYDYSLSQFVISQNILSRSFGGIYFDSEENCQKAIDLFKYELIWYFTEYRDRV